jgi:hypothetical protein
MDKVAAAFEDELCAETDDASRRVAKNNATLISMFYPTPCAIILSFLSTISSSAAASSAVVPCLQYVESIREHQIGGSAILMRLAATVA